jgi:hemerythrin-like domain-containing protein
MEVYMEKFLNSGVKDVIKDYPVVGEILGEYGVGCVNCTLGSCLLKDVISIHNMSRNEERHMMGAIEKAIYPEREIVIPEDLEEEPIQGEISYSEPVNLLVLEHVNIKKLLGKIPELCSSIEKGSDAAYATAAESVEFIKNYADSFHHAKEEDILFKFGVKNQEIIDTMLEEHKLGRWFVKRIIKGIEKRDSAMVIENLQSYGELLIEHIRKEDTILYPFIDRNLSVEEVLELKAKFKEVDNAMSVDKYLNWLQTI